MLKDEVLEDINNDKAKFEFYFNLINKNSLNFELILNDYIVFYLDKHLDKEEYFNSYNKIIELLLNLRLSS